MWRLALVTEPRAPTVNDRGPGVEGTPALLRTPTPFFSFLQYSFPISDRLSGEILETDICVSLSFNESTLVRW